jgi:hypothetical protein
VFLLMLLLDGADAYVVPMLMMLLSDVVDTTDGGNVNTVMWSWLMLMLALVVGCS